MRVWFGLVFSMMFVFVMKFDYDVCLNLLGLVAFCPTMYECFIMGEYNYIILSYAIFAGSFFGYVSVLCPIKKIHKPICDNIALWISFGQRLKMWHVYYTFQVKVRRFSLSYLLCVALCSLFQRL